MRVKLNEIPVYWINLDGRKDRQQSMSSLFRRLRTAAHERISAVKQEPYYLGRNASHQIALRRGMNMGRYPFLVLEDDVQETPFYENALDIPETCRLLYLGISIWNSFPENLRETGLPDISRFEPFDEQFYRIRNVLSTHAILYFDQDICSRQLKALDETFRGNTHLDIGFAKAQSDVLCLAPRKGPFFFRNDPQTRWCTSHWINPGRNHAELIRKRYLRLFEKPHVVLFCRHLGGFGGEEHLNQSVIDALKEVRTTVFVQKSLDNSGLLPLPRGNLSIQKFKPKRLLNFLYRNEDNVALFIRISPDPFKGEKAIFRFLRGAPYPKLINPAGNPVDRVVDYYDYVLWECDNAETYGMTCHPKNLIVRPPAFRPLNETSTPGFPQNMPPRPFYLTVFNNYQADIKGMDGLTDVLDTLSCPLVWCSRRFGPEAPDHPRLIKMTVDRDFVLLLMRECKAYISFSRSEGFGWSVFEAMMYRKPVFSRPTGIAGEFPEQIFLYNTYNELAERLSEPFPPSVEYDLSAFSPEAFLRTFYGLIRPDSWHGRHFLDLVRYLKSQAGAQFSRLRC